MDWLLVRGHPNSPLDDFNVVFCAFVDQVKKINNNNNLNIFHTKTQGCQTKERHRPYTCSLGRFLHFVKKGPKCLRMRPDSRASHPSSTVRLFRRSTISFFLHKSTFLEMHRTVQ